MSLANRILPVVGGAVAGGAIALIVAGGSTTTHSVTTAVAPSRQAAVPAAFSAGHGLSVNQISRNASPGVVDITVTSASQAPDLFGQGGSQQTQGEGAGVVYDKQGDIVTDEHVVAGASSVQVTFSDGHKYPARVLGTDPSTDVAVIHVDAPASELHPLAFADSSAAQVGDNVVAIGSPFGLPGTVTTGIVSAVNRSIQAPNQYTITGAIQTDAPINPGNSGGPLLDANGRVLGLNDQIETNTQSSSGVGFAVPSNTVARVAKEIIGGKVVKHSYLGIHLKSGSPATVSTDSSSGSAVAPGSPAASAGIRPGDVISAINGKSIGSTEQFISTVDGYSPGTTVTLTIKRGAQSSDVKVTLGTRPS
jgi:putative serine protease PepD